MPKGLFNNKMGVDAKASASANMSKWDLPAPGSRAPVTAPAKPDFARSGGQYANKTANTPSGTHGMVSNIKSRY